MSGRGTGLLEPVQAYKWEPVNLFNAAEYEICDGLASHPWWSRNMLSRLMLGNQDRLR